MKAIAGRVICGTVVWLSVSSLAVGQAPDNGKQRQPIPRIVGHRGLLRSAPENTLAGFAACIDLRIGFELDVRRTRDGQLVCLHDPDLKRTTNGKGPVTAITAAELVRLDAGSWFAPEFVGQRVPLLHQVFELMRSREARDILVALDVKAEDEQVEADMVALAKRYGVLGQIIFIGRTIGEPAVRARLRGADVEAGTSVLVAKAADLPAALADATASWIYFRYLPSEAEMGQLHRLGKRSFLSGPPLAGNDIQNWLHARAIGADGLLTDFPLEVRELWRTGKRP
jgi:glycerophosphoryl diester phosphodiesterase